MLRGWLGSTTLETFRAQHLQRAPLASPTTVSRSLLDWSLLDEVLAVDPAPDALVVARGRHLPVPAPRSLAELKAYFELGVGVCLRATEHCHPVLRAVADAFEADVGSAHVQIFATPGGTHGFGWHFDDEDVFVAQTEGHKDYYFRANTVVADEVRARGSVLTRPRRCAWRR
jgi:50S ribosomal protein L16 3-hydroxylase